jgi:ketosteroid isomerase-like protein
MSQENVEVIRRFHEALNRRDVDAMVAVWDDDAEFRPIMSALEAQVYQGHDGLRAWLRAIFQDWEVFEAYDEEFHDLGDRVLSFGRWHACGRTSGIALDINTAAWLVRLRDGKVIWWQTFTNRAEALEAAGIEESATSQENVEIVRRFYDAWARDGVPGPQELMDPDIEYVNPDYAVEPGIRRGRRGFMDAVARTDAAFDHQVLELEQLIEGRADKVLGLTTFRARGRESGVELHVPEQHVWTLRAGKVVRFEWFHDRGEAFKAAGLRQ